MTSPSSDDWGALKAGRMVARVIHEVEKCAIDDDAFLLAIWDAAVSLFDVRLANVVTVGEMQARWDAFRRAYYETCQEELARLNETAS